MAITLIFKMADLAHTACDWELHERFSLSLAEEYYQQGDQEIMSGLALTPLCDRANHGDFAKFQTGFIRYVVMPLVDEIVVVDRNSRANVEIRDRVLANMHRWEQMEKNGEQVPMPESIKQHRIAHPLFVGIAVFWPIRRHSLKELAAAVTWQELANLIISPEILERLAAEQNN